MTASFGPYAPDLQGALRSFGQTTAYYDANGHYARISPVTPSFTLGANNNLTPGLERRSRSCRRCRPASCAAARAPRPSPRPTARRRSRTTASSAAIPRRPPSEPPPPRIPGRKPAPDRGADDADRGRRGVPVVQRQQRAAVRADVQHQGRTARNLGPAESQPGADRGHARRDHQLADAPPEPQHGPNHRDRRTEARKERRTAAGGHQSDRAVGLGDRAEVPGTRKGDLQPAAEGGRSDPDGADARTGGHRLAVQHVRPEDEDRDPEQHDQLRQRSRRPRDRAERNDRHTAPAGEQRPSRCCTTSASPQTGFRKLFPALDQLASQVAPVAEHAGRHGSATSTPSSPPGRAWRPRWKQTIAGGPAALAQATHSLRLRGAVRRKRHRVHAPAAPERERAA